MTVAEPDLAARARRAYERGRLRWALERAAAAAAVAALALVGCSAPGAPAASAAGLGLVVAACLWRGGSWARGAQLGFVAGLAPCLLPAAARAAHACCDRFCVSMPPLCLAAGILAGVLLGWMGLRVQGDRRLWLAATAAAVLTGATGCLAAGLAGLAGMALGLIAGAAAPVLAARAA